MLKTTLTPFPADFKFITWREVPRAGKKPDKVPVCARTGKNINCLDPKNWLTEAEAKATGLNMGIVFTADDPWFFLDLDNCFNNGAWDEGVRDIVALFEGCAREISYSNNGLHIIGQCDASIIGSRRKKFKAFGVSCEVYTQDRYAALGHGFQGDFNIDASTAFDNFVPKTDNVVALYPVAGAGPVLEYTGPAADNVLVEAMLKSQGSKAARFGDKAKISELWNRKVEKLRVHFPSGDGREFDYSSADIALLGHLAYWTGKDSVRMERIFNMSKLAERDKWKNRSDYRALTVKSAVVGCQGVYDIPRKTTPGELLDIGAQKTHFEGCVYVCNLHSILVPKGIMLKEGQFKVMYGGHQFVMSFDGSKATYNAWDAFTENRIFEFPRVARTRFLPAKPYGEIVGDGVNVYYQHSIPTQEGDVRPFLELLEKMLPQEHDREILLGWMASLIQNPGVKFLFSPVLQGTKGNGKGFMSECLIHAAGEEYAWSVKPQKIDAKFNLFLQDRLLIVVNEMNMFAKRDMLDTLKDYITESRQEVERKGIDAKMVNDYCANWFFATNSRSGVIKDRDDRRFCVFFTAQQRVEDLARDRMLGDYFPKLWAWAKAGGFACVRHYLLNYKIVEGLDPAKDCFRAPDSTSTGEAILASLGSMAQLVMDSIESEQTGFKGGWASSYYVAAILENMGIRNRSTSAISKIMDSIGYIRKGRCSKHIMQEGNTRPVLYCSPTCTTDYMVAQGYARKVRP